MEKQHASFKNYPCLTPEEFTEVVHHLDSRYCRATLGPVRRQWRLRACTALNTSSSFAVLGPEYNTYIQIIRPLESLSLENDDISKYLDQFSFGDDEAEVDEEMMEGEEGDDEVCLVFMNEYIEWASCGFLSQILTRSQSPFALHHNTRNTPQATLHTRSTYTRHIKPLVSGSAYTTSLWTNQPSTSTPFSDVWYRISSRMGFEAPWVPLAASQLM